jgi:hypothetical protein
MQPVWKSYIALDRDGAIEVSAFQAVYRGNPDSVGSNDRRNLLDAFDMTDAVNADIFAGENAASRDGTVRHLF